MNLQIVIKHSILNSLCKFKFIHCMKDISLQRFVVILKRHMQHEYITSSSSIKDFFFGTFYIATWVILN